MTRRIWPALLLAFVVFATFPAGAQASPVTRALDYLHAKQRSSGGFGTGTSADAQITPWAIMAISAARENPQRWTNGGKNPIRYLQGLDLEVAAGSASTQVNRASFYAKVILAYVAAGRVDLIGSAGSKGIQLVPKLLSYQNTTTGAFSPWGATATNPYATVNTTIWAILALKAAGETDGGLEAAITWLVAQQNANGGFGSQPSAASDVDDTAAAIMALRARFSNRNGMSASNPAIVDALAYLKSMQRYDGGFPSMSSDGRSYAESTAWAIQAIVACDQPPSSWDKGGRTPISFLQSLQQRSGLFAHRRGAVSSPLMTTTQAAIALMRKPFPFGLANDTRNRVFRPHFNTFTPSGNPTFKTSTVYVKATYADNVGGTGIRLGAVRVTVDGVGKTRAATVRAGSLALKLTGLRNGTHTVIIRIADWAGNGLSRTRKFTVAVPVTPPSTGGGGGTGGTPGYRWPYPSSSATPSTPPVLTPTPSATATTASSTPGTVTGTPLGASPSASPGAPLTAGTQPSPSASVTGQATANGQDGGSGTAGWIGLGLVALLPLGALASYVVHRRQAAALEGAGRGRALLGGGTPWERFKARILGVSNAVTLKR